MDTPVMQGFQFASNLLLSIFYSIFGLLRSSDLTKPLIYIFIIGSFIGVLRLLIGSGGGSGNE